MKPDLNEEARRVRRTLAGNLAIVGQRQGARLRPFLKLGLGILRRPHCRAHQRPPETMDEAPGRIQTAIQIEGGDHGLAAVGQQARIAGATGFLFAPRNLDKGTQINLLRHVREGIAADQKRKPAGKGSFIFAGIGLVEKLRNDEPEHAVAEKLQALIRRATAAGMAGDTGVRQRLLKQGRVGEGMLQLRNKVLTSPVG